jgi:hypothetical protein
MESPLASVPFASHPPKSAQGFRRWRLPAALAFLCALACVAEPLRQSPHLNPAFGQLPIFFQPLTDGGPSYEPVYLCRGQGYAMRISPVAVDIWFRPNPDWIQDRRRGLTADDDAGTNVDLDAATSPGWLRMRLLGANESAVAMPEAALGTRVHELRGRDPARWRRNVPTYSRLRYAGVYPGIDAVYYGNQRQLEYDFVVAPHADPDQVRLQFDGADRLELAENGDLVIEFGDRQTRLKRPFLYQDSATGRQPVEGAYALESGPDWVVRFEVGAYDTARPLVIDPVLVYSTYLGGLGYDQGSGIAVDAVGHAYVTGETASTDFPVANALWPTNSGGFDGSTNPLGNEAFVAKFDPTGTNLLFATYLGGEGVDAAIAIAIDVAGHAYVTGLTASTNFPITPNAVQSTLPGEPRLGFHPYSAFLSKLSVAGDELLYSTYLGGMEDDQGLAIAVDPLGAVYVTGSTRSSDFPVHDESVQFGGSSDVFVAKLSATNKELIYSTLLGGGGAEFGQGIAVDAAGHAIVTGQTSSGSFPVTNAVQGRYQGGSYDAFVSKLTSDGRALVFSTYLGGSNSDEALGIATDAAGNSYLTGYTASGGFPSTNALFSTKASGRDAFLTKLSPTGALLSSTFLGGNSDDEGWAVAVDPTGRATIVGTTRSGNFPLTNALQTARGGNRDLFVTRLNPARDALEFSTYLGGRNQDEARAVAVDPLGGIYVTGFTLSTDFPVAPGTDVFQRSFGGGTGDAFLLKIQHTIASLEIARTPVGTVEISWSAALANFVLESKPIVTATNDWAAVMTAPVNADGRQTVTLTNLTDTQFYRLRRAD